MKSNHEETPRRSDEATHGSRRGFFSKLLAASRQLSSFLIRALSVLICGSPSWDPVRDGAASRRHRRRSRPGRRPFLLPFPSSPSPSLSTSETDPVGDLNIVVLVKGRETYVFVFDDAPPNRQAAAATLDRFANDPQLSFSVHDATFLRQRILGKTGVRS